jgi:hypothetical protein
MAAYVAELVYKDAGTQYGKVINYNLAGYLGAVAEYAVVTYHAVMGNVHVLHEQVVVADHGLTLGCGTAVNGNVLADTVIVTYLGSGILTTEFEILRNTADHGSRMYLVAVAYA